MRESLVDRHAVERLLLIVGALRSGLVDVLAGRQALTAEEVAARAGADRRATEVMLEALVAEELVQVERGLEPAGVGQGLDGPRYRLTPLARAHLVEEGPDLERWGLLHQANKIRGWLELAEVIRTGRPPVKDKPVGDLCTMAAAMGERDPAVLAEITDRCFAYAGTIDSMLDVGGAVGHLARSFARRGVKVTLFDREEVVNLAREFLGSDAEQVELVGGDFTVSLPLGPFDLVYFGNVYHIYGPDTNARVTREAFWQTVPGGTVAIQDYVRGRSRAAALFAVNMLRSTENGGVWSEGQYRSWLEGAGFGEIEVQDLESAPSQIILARRPDSGA